MVAEWQEPEPEHGGARPPEPSAAAWAPPGDSTLPAEQPPPSADFETPPGPPTAWPPPPPGAPPAPGYAYGPPPDGPPARPYAYGPPPGAQPVQGYGHPYSYGYAQQPQLDKGARTSLVVALIGILFCGVLLGPAAIVEGAKARTRIRESQGMLTGDGLALAGIIVGAAVTLLSLVGMAMIFAS